MHYPTQKKKDGQYMKKKISIIGLGNRGTEYMGFLKAFHSSKVEIHALCDIRQQALDDVAPKFSIPKERQFLSPEKFFSKGVISDALIISTQDASHYEITKQAILTGYKYILLEKPVSGIEKEYTELRDLAEEHNVLLIICHVLRYSNYYSKIKEIISEDAANGKICSEIAGVAVSNFDTIIRNYEKNRETTIGIYETILKQYDIIYERFKAYE